jgi:hypothetical protein
LEFFVPRPLRPVDRDNPGDTEDLLEMALVNESAHIPSARADIDVLMRQFPLFSTGSRKGVRGVDLVGHGGDRFWLIELKAQPGKGYGESPLRALLECLIYSAVADESAKDIRRELLQKFNREHLRGRAGMMIAAPTDYWVKWEPNAATGDWWHEFERLIQGIQVWLDAPIEVVDLGDVSPVIDDQGRSRLSNPISVQSVTYPLQPHEK